MNVLIDCCKKIEINFFSILCMNENTMSHLRGLDTSKNITFDMISDVVNATIENSTRYLRVNGDTTYNNMKLWFGIIGFLLCIKFIMTIAMDMKKMNEKKFTPRISELYATSPPPFILTPSDTRGQMSVTINYESLTAFNKKIAKKKPRKMSQQDVIINI